MKCISFALSVCPIHKSSPLFFGFMALWCCQYDVSCSIKIKMHQLACTSVALHMMYDITCLARASHGSTLHIHSFTFCFLFVPSDAFRCWLNFSATRRVSCRESTKSHTKIIPHFFRLSFSLTPAKLHNVRLYMVRALYGKNLLFFFVFIVVVVVCLCVWCVCRLPTCAHYHAGNVSYTTVRTKRTYIT